MKPRSLRGRLLLSSILWTVGLLFASALPFTLIMEQQERLRIALRVHRFFQNPIVVVAALCCMAAGLVVARGGLASVEVLRSRLNRLRAGGERRMDGTYPAEVQPLVDDLNALLDHRDRAIERAIAESGDLAHGLKTPLAILAHEAQRARASGQGEMAAAIEQQVERMQRQVDYHLAHARAAASGAGAGARSLIKESAEGVVRALRRLHAGRGIVLHVDVPGQLAVRVRREDLDEMLGNLLDNACKWARARVTISAAHGGGEGEIAVVVEDDGSGIAPALREAVLRRGVRADETAPGSGLGLAIVRDLADLYGGAIDLGASRLGGLRAILTLPAADGAPR
jgi:signal transduction histidine kinase